MRRIIMATCETCERDPCRFDVIGKRYIQTKYWEEERDIIVSINSALRTATIIPWKKRIFHEFVIWNGTMIELPTPCLSFVLKQE